MMRRRIFLGLVVAMLGCSTAFAAASYPASKKTFSAVVNGVTKLVASLFNTPYDEIEAIETMLGPTGSAQSYSTSFKELLLAYRRGCAVEYKGAADLYVRSGEIAVPDASGNVHLRRNTSDTTVTWTDIDTGSEANSTQYYVYALADDAATTFSVHVSTNATTPSGHTFYKKIGGFYNDESGNITAVWDDVFPSDIYDYSTNASAPTLRNMGSMRIACGTIAVAQGSYTDITGLPFTSASSYVAFCTDNGTAGKNINVPPAIQRISGSSLRIINDDGDEGTLNICWIAIGV